MPAKNTETIRLEEAREGKTSWKKWGLYPERAPVGHSAGGLQRGRHPGLREAMAQELLKLAGIAEGVRCDMAMLILPEVFQRTWGERSLPTDGSPPVDALFWPETIGRVKARNPGFIFMAEVYWDLEWTIMQQGFDYCYDKSLYDRLLSRDAAAVRAHLWADMAYQNRLARFLENHDEPPGRPMIFRRRCTRPQPSSPSLLPACGSFMKVNSKAAGSRSSCIWAAAPRNRLIPSCRSFTGTSWPAWSARRSGTAAGSFWKFARPGRATPAGTASWPLSGKVREISAS